MYEPILTDCLGKSPTMTILSFFLGHPQNDYAKNELAKMTDQSRQTVYKAITPLINYGLIIESRIIGHTQLYTLNVESDQVRALMTFNAILVEQIVNHEMGFTPKLEGTPDDIILGLNKK